MILSRSGFLTLCKMTSVKNQWLDKAKKRFRRNEQILGCLRSGWSARKIATEYSINYSSAKKLCNLPKNGDSREIKPRSSRPRKKKIREDRYSIREPVKVCDSTEVSLTAPDLAESLKERSSTEVSRWAVQRRLYEHELKKVVKTKKPFVSPPNRRKRVEFARRYSHLTVQQWKKVLSSDESPFVIR